MKIFSLFILLFTISLCVIGQVPVVTSLNPSSGKIGNSVTISGANFGATAADNVVYIGGTRASITSASSTSITVNVPGGSQNVPVIVTNTSTGLQGRSLNPFSYIFGDPGSKNFSSASFSETTRSNVNNYFESWCQLADMDGDGKLDLGVLDASGQIITLYKNNTNQGSLPESSLPLSATFELSPEHLSLAPRNLHFGDVDGDGRPEMMLAYGGGIKVYRNVSTPGTLNQQSFASPVAVATTNSAGTVSLADLNNDGKPELIIGKGQSVGIVVNNTTKGNITSASFGAVQNCGNFVPGGRIETADLDGDGKTDLVVSGSEMGSFVVMFNTTPAGSSTFSFTSANYVIGKSYDSPVFAVVADMDGDGKKDIIATTYDNIVKVYKNTSAPGNVSFATPLDVQVTNVAEIINTKLVEVIDVDGDGKPDIILGSYIGKFSIIPNTSSGGNLSFGVTVTLSRNGSEYPVLAVGDMDCDGKPDIVGTASANNVYLWHNNIVGSPVLNSISPATAKTGDVVTITGKNLTSTKSVKFGDLAATSFNVVSDNTLTAVVAKRSTSGNVTVTNADGTSTIAGFTYVPPPPPQITGITPISAEKDATITITGANFNLITGVSFGGIKAQSFTVKSSTEINAILAVGASGDVTVTGDDGIATFAGFNYIARPIIEDFSPFSAPKGGVITIDGYNFTGITKVTFGTTDAASFTVVSPTRIQAVVGDGDEGPIAITNSFGTGTSYFTFYFTGQRPVINSFSPLQAPAGATVTITGKNFSSVPANNSVYFGAAKATVLSATTTALTVKVPNGATYQPISIACNNLFSYSDRFFSLTYPGGGVINNASFANKYSIPLTTTTYNMSAGDLNGDGSVDLVLATFGSMYATAANNYSEPGKFSLPTYALSTNSRPTDGPVDLIPVNTGRLDLYGSFKGGSITGVKMTNVDWNHPPGYIFTRPASDLINFTGVNSVSNAAAGDLDLDGLPDLIIAGLGSYLNIALGDLDGDGKQDLIVRNATGTISLYRNISTPGNKNYETKVDINVDADPFSVAVGDLDGDGKPDLAVACNGTGGNGTVVILKNNSTTGNFNFNGVKTLANIGVAGKVCVADIDGDGVIDLAVGSNTNTLLYKGRVTAGNIDFADPVTIPINSSKTLIICDFDADGRPDIAGMGPTEVTILKNMHGEPALTSFAPKQAVKGGTITITGTNFWGVTAVEFGGKAAKSFVVNSNTSVTAVVDDAGASGNVTLINNAGAGSIAGFTFVTTPLITASGTANLGVDQSVTLSTPLVDGVTYKWLKNGIVIPGATGLSYSASVTGSYTVAIIFNGQDLVSLPVQVNDILANRQPPVIVPDRSTTLAKGSIIQLSTDPLTGGASGISYRWAKNGVPLTETNYIIAINQPGSYTVTIVYKGQELASAPIQIYPPVETFKVQAFDATCRGSNNGVVQISSGLANITATITGNSINSSYPLTIDIIQKIENLKPGAYQICFTLNGQPDFQRCFTVVINEPKDLSVYSVVDKSTNTLTLQLSGGDTYHITLNGINYSTNQGQIKLSLSKGTNSLQITTDKDCQGIYKQLVTLDGSVVYPIPFTDVLNIDLADIQQVKVQVVILDIYGKKVYDGTLTNNDGKASVNLSHLPLGAYILKLGASQSVYKIWKK